MKLKLDDKGNAVLQDGKPVYVHDDGKEIAFDAPQAMAKIKDLSTEAKNHRERAESATEKLKSFGDLDPEAAKKAVATVKNLDDKKLVDAGQVEQMKAEVAKGYETKLAAEAAKTAAIEGQLHAELVGGRFTRSKFAAEKLAVPADMVQAQFGRHFKVEDGKVVATDASGNKLYSRAKPGEFADFDEALEMLVDTYPHKDQILKATAKGGSGGNGGGGSGGGGGLPGSLKDCKTDAERVAYLERVGAR